MLSPSEKILSNPVNRWVFSNSKNELYLVGGYIRDYLLDNPTSDIDYAVRKDPRGIAIRTAKKFKGAFITLKKNHTYRIVLESGRSVDFTPLEGSITENLRKRDFTINAMAWRPGNDIIDPFGGIGDLGKKLVSEVLSSNFADDPLRVLRAYRHAAQLGFNIEKKTRLHIKKYAKSIHKVASERITEELIKIINIDNGDYIKACHKDGVLGSVISSKSIRLSENIKLLHRYHVFTENYTKNIISDQKRRKFKRFLAEEISQGLTRDGLFKLGILLIDNTDYMRSDKNMKFSTVTKNALKVIHRSCKLSKGRVTDRHLYEIFTASDKMAIEAAFILTAIKTDYTGKLMLRAEEFLKQQKKKLLTGNEIKGILKIQQGVLIGRIMSSISERRFYGKLKKKSDARAWIMSYFT
jgi:tRNA nucleotidyltransferase/poly(A) polymerase